MIPSRGNRRLNRPSSAPHRLLKPPQRLSDGSGGDVGLDGSSYRHIVQDVTSVKTMLLRLKRVLEEVSTC